MADVLKGELSFNPFGKIVFGRNAVSERIADEMRALGRKRALIVTGNTLATKTDLVERTRTALGEACAGVFSGAAQHVPRDTVLAGAAMAQELKADALVVLGGSSAVDTTKGIALIVAEGPVFEDLKVKYLPPDQWIAPPLEKPKMPIIAIPTTLSGSEFTHAAGIKDMAIRSRELFLDPKVTPRVVILDPEMTVATGQELWAGTCLKILCDCVEMVCSINHQPYSDALCLAAAEMIFRDLPASIGDPLNLAARGRLQHTPLMVMPIFTNIGVGYAAGLRHVLGGMTGANHGTLSSIVMPHVMEFNIPSAAERLALIARAAGVHPGGQDAEVAAKAAVEAVRGLVRQMGLPMKLSEVGVRRSDFDIIASRVFADHVAQTNPRKARKEDIIELLGRAY